MAMKRRVVISGMGIVAPNGRRKEAFWQALIRGLSGVQTIRRFDASPLPTRIAGEIQDFDPLEFMDAQEAKKMDRNHQLALAASLMAMEDAGLTQRSIESSERIGSAMGNAVCGLGTMDQETQVLWERGPRWGSPYFAIAFFCCGANGVTSIRLHLKGPILTLSNGNTSSTDAIGAGFRLIQSGRADVMLCGGTEAPLVPLFVDSMSRDGWLSTRNDNPAAASRPFDRHSDGMVLGEGAAMLVLEDRQHALDRGATIYAEVGGYSSYSSAYHLLHPEPNGLGLVRTMNAALREAGVERENVDWICAQGLSMLDYDRMESRCIRKTFGEDQAGPPVSAITPLVGNPLGALGALQGAACALALRHQVMPPHANVSAPDSQYPIRLSPPQGEPSALNAVLQNSYCFMGKHSSLVYQRHEAAS